MTDIDYEYTKGEVVIANRRGSGTQVSSQWRSVSFDEGDELIISSVKGTRLNVRKDGGYVFTIEREDVRPVGADYRELGQVPPGGISPDDPGLAWLWEDAAKLASRKSYCSQYDELTDELGIPGRLRNFTITLQIEESLSVTATVPARSRSEAESILSSKLGRETKEPASV